MTDSILVLIGLIIALAMIVIIILARDKVIPKLNDDFNESVNNKTPVHTTNDPIDEIISELKSWQLDSSTTFTFKWHYFSLLKLVLSKFDISDPQIKEAYLDTYSDPNDNKEDIVDVILLRAIFDVAGGSDLKDFINAASEVLRDLLFQFHNGYLTDWKYNDEDVQFLLNEVLEKSRLKLEFSDHSWENPFEIRLIDLNNNELIASKQFEYSDKKRHDQHKLINLLNELLATRDLELIDINDGSDSYQAIVFKKDCYNKLQTSYGENFLRLIRPQY